MKEIEREKYELLKKFTEGEIIELTIDGILYEVPFVKVTPTHLTLLKEEGGEEELDLGRIDRIPEKDKNNAIEKAKIKSLQNKDKMYFVILSKGVYHVDDSGYVRTWETLIGAYEKGKKVKL